MSSESVNIFDIVNTLSYGKDEELKEHPDFERTYAPFMVNRAFSNYPDTVLWANEANRFPYEMPKSVQFDFYFHALNRKKRFSKWAKKSKDSDIELISTFYNISHRRAMEIRDLVDMDHIKEKLYTGGRG